MHTAAEGIAMGLNSAFYAVQMIKSSTSGMFRTKYDNDAAMSLHKKEIYTTSYYKHNIVKEQSKRPLTILENHMAYEVGSKASPRSARMLCSAMDGLSNVLLRERYTPVSPIKWTG